MAIIRRGSETALRDVSWFWKPMIPVGKVTILEGDGGDGKTTLILTVAAGLSVGAPPPTLQDGKLLPADPIPPVTTFYLTNEDEIADSSLRRFIRAGGDPDRFTYSGEMEHHVTLNEPELRQIIQDSGARLIIIDPFQAFLPEKTHLNNITRMREIFTMLANVAKSTDTAIVLVGHLNKNESGKDIHRGFGSADIAASVRSILLVEMDKHRNRFVRAIKSNFDESDYSPIRLVFDENRCLSFEEPSKSSIWVTAPTCSRPRFSAGNGEPSTEPSKSSIWESTPSYSHTGEPSPNPSSKEFPLPRDERKRDLAESLLKEWLQPGPLPIAEIQKRLRKAGISFRTAQRARQRIGIVSTYVNNDLCWKLT